MPNEFDGFRLHRAGLSLLAAALLVSLGLEAGGAQELPPYLRDRGTGVASSMFGTYVRKGELLVNPFVEWYYDSDLRFRR